MVVNNPSILSPEQLGRLAVLNESTEKSGQNKGHLNESRCYRDDDITQYVDSIIEHRLGGYNEIAALR